MTKTKESLQKDRDMIDNAAQVIRNIHNEVEKNYDLLPNVMETKAQYENIQKSYHELKKYKDLIQSLFLVSWRIKEQIEEIEKV